MKTFKKYESFQNLNSHQVDELLKNTNFLSATFDGCEFKNLFQNKFYSCNFFNCSFFGEIKDCEFNASRFGLCGVSSGKFIDCGMLNICQHECF